MKKLILFALVAAAFLLLAPAAQAAPTCHGGFCYWTDNSSFDEGGTLSSAPPWVQSQYTTFPSRPDPCLWGTPNNRAAELRNAGWLYQRIHPDGSGVRFKVQFDLELLNDRNNWYDQLRIVVKNLDTNTLEVFQINGNSFNSTCRKEFYLSGDYRDHDVELKFEVAALALGTFRIDNVMFWSSPW